ncbi:MAG: thioredoxin [Lachnospiraceae bacterium]|nr:thioredoxin [Lachnospiraceae bacterium]
MRGSGRSLTGIRLLLLALSAGLILHGIWNGSMHDVFIKAVNICTECIGLG